MNREQAVARLAGRQFEQRLRMFGAGVAPAVHAQIGRNSAGAAWVARSMRGCLVHWFLSNVDVGEFGSEQREPEFQAPAGPCEMSSSQHIASIAGEAGADQDDAGGEIRNVQVSVEGRRRSAP